MDEAPPLRHDLEQRILLLAPTRRDAAAAGPAFEQVGIRLTLCENLEEICTEIERGAAVAIVPDEDILRDTEGRLSRLLKDQPPWSDLPLIVMTPTRPTEAVERLHHIVGHMTLVRRPIEIRTLASTIQAALRDRRRQYARREEFIERERQAETLRENARQKGELLAMLAHELRNPISAINNGVTVLQLAPAEESRLQAREMIARQVKHLARLLDDLLDISRLTSGKVHLKREHVDARSIVELAVESAKPVIDDRRHALSVSLDSTPLPLDVDVTRASQIVQNLLINAAKYTDPGGTIWLSARRDGDDVVIRVRDNGMGIPREQLPCLFELFHQGERSLARSEGGLGIGLTIVKRLTELHGGRVEARSEGPRHGSEFVVRLPMAEIDETEPLPHSGLAHQGSGGERILVVDDNVDAARTLALYLQLMGKHVLAVHDGHAALEATRSFRPDYVLLDIGLPGIDGYEVASTLRNDSELGNDPVIIAVSGYGRPEDQRRSQEAGFHHHMVKPVDFDVLMSLIGGDGVSR